ncbi:MAG: ABC transporter permease, partial [Chloroflexota bacterium]
MTTRRLFLRRVPQTLLVALGVGLVAFGITRLLPGDAASTWAGPRASLEELALVREQLGLDRPLPEQVVSYLVGLVQGDWGISIHTRQPVLDDVLGRLVASLELVGMAMLIALSVGILLGMAGARWKGRWPDWITSGVTAVLVSAPIFWLGLLLQLTVATELDLLPVAGRFDREYRDAVAEQSLTGLLLIDSVLALNGPLFASSLTHVLLPALVVAAYPTGLIARLFRAALIETLG